MMQNLRSELASFIRRFRKGAEKNISRLDILEDVKHFEGECAFDKQALIMLYPDAWLTALAQHPNIKLYNHTGFVYSIVKALNINGYAVFNAESDARYARFRDKYQVQGLATHKRSMEGMHEGLEFLNSNADVLFSINCPRMCAAYGKYSDKFYYTGLGAYIDPLFKINESEKDFDKGRKNFIYVGGTSGNLQKGLDLLIEAFSQKPDLNLYIYCKVV